MTRASAPLTVDPQGASIIVSISYDPSGTASPVTAMNGSSAISLPDTISTTKTYWLPPARYIVSATLNGVTIHDQSYDLDGSQWTTVTPVLDFAETTALIGAGSGASGAGPQWTNIPISVTEGDWTLDAGWVWNGDGTVTSTDVGSTNLATLPLAAIANAAGLGLMLQIPITFTGDAEVQIGVDQGGFGAVTGLDIALSGTTATPQSLYDGIPGAGVTTATIAAGEHLYSVVILGSALAALYIDGTPIVATRGTGLTSAASLLHNTFTLYNYSGSATTTIDLSRVVVDVLGVPA